MYIGTSWKMHKTRPEAVAWITTVRANLPTIATNYQIFVIPPYTAITAVRDAFANTPIWVGAQNVHDEEEGAFTGEISARMLADLGCNLVEIGHWERRKLYNETDVTVARKVRLVLNHGMRPLVCIGEPQAIRDANKGIAYTINQAKMALTELDLASQARCLLAYEPIWAIGVAGTVALLSYVKSIYVALKQLFPATKILYGGGINLANAADFAATDTVDGLFIGRAALSATNFSAIINNVLIAHH